MLSEGTLCKQFLSWWERTAITRSDLDWPSTWTPHTLTRCRGQSLPYHTVLLFPLSRTPWRVWLLLRACVYPQKERHRVRCINEGHRRLRKHLQQELEDKWLSKVETLQVANKHPRSLLDLNASGIEVSLRDTAPLQQRTDSSKDGEYWLNMAQP